MAKVPESIIQDGVDKFNNLPKYIQHALIGSSSGWLTGFTLVKFGRYAGFSISATIILIQLGHHYGYINVDWRNVDRDLKKAKEEVGRHASNVSPETSERIQRLIKDNAMMVSTFIGGFLLGTSTN